METSSSRQALRTAGLIGLAVAAVLVTGVVYLRPSFRAPAPAVTRPSPGPAVGSAFFADADHGLVAVIPTGGGSNPTATLFLTRDGGHTWSRELRGPVSMILSSPLSGSRLFVIPNVQPGAGVRVSGDGGRTWRTLPAPPGVVQSNVVYGAGGSPVLLSATDGWWMAWPARGDPYTVQLWRTQDGSTWTRLPATGIPREGIKEQLWFADERHGVLLVTDPSAWVAVLATDDGGMTWREAARFGSPFLGAWIMGAVVVPLGRRLVVCLETLPNPPNSSVSAGPFALNAGVYTATSSDGGASWSPLVPGPGLSAASVPQFDDRGRMLLLSDRQLWVSETYGAAWQSRPVVLPAGVRVLSLNSAVRGALFAIGVQSTPAPQVGVGGFQRVLLRSRDGGAHWQQLALPALAG